MVLHVTIIAIQCAAVAAFLILWYFWVKGKLGASAFLEDEDQILFPFRYFSWVLAGVIVATCLAQVHFVRVSSVVHERMTGLNDLYSRQANQAQTLAELKEMIGKVREDMHSNFKGLRIQIAESASVPTIAEPATPKEAVQRPTLTKPSLLSLSDARGEAGGNEFAREAKAASSPDPVRSPGFSRPGPAQDEQPDHFMQLSREGRILTDHLRVRTKPLTSASVVDKLMTGQQVKVTGKRLKGSRIWYRVVTPAGRAGWVDFKYVRLEGDV
ncbi:MAG: SH3 domain-containing protein [Desulfomonilaceae bacterium]|nr:SH3 domain-containing protein [Desulfomonilaceae bacterium]